MELPGFLKGRGVVYVLVVTLSLLIYIGLTGLYGLGPLAPLDDEDEWTAYSIEISALLPTVQQTARRATPEELVASGQATLPQRSEPQIRVNPSSSQPQSRGTDTGGAQEGTSVKLQKRYKLSVGGKRAEVKRRPRGNHAGAEIGRGKEEEPQKPPPVQEEDPLTPSDRMLLEKNGVWEGIRLGVSIGYDPPVWQGEPPEFPVVSPGLDDPRQFIFECNRSNPRSDVCTVRGNVQLYADSKTFQMFATGKNPPTGILSVTPYARKAKGEVAPGSTTTLELTSYGLKTDADVARELANCNRNVSVPGVVFSIGGKADNYYYALEDTLVPLILTSFKYDREVVFLLLDWHEWWLEHFRGVLKTLSKYPPILIGGPGVETERDQEHARVKDWVRSGSASVEGEEVGHIGVEEGVKGAEHGGDDPRAVFEKPADLLPLLTRRRKALGLEGLPEGLGAGLEKSGQGLEKPGQGLEERDRALSAGLERVNLWEDSELEDEEDGRGEDKTFFRKLLQLWTWQKKDVAANKTESGLGAGQRTVPVDESVTRGSKRTRGSWEWAPIPGAKERRAAVQAEVWPELNTHDRNIYCFPELVIGLTTHGNLRVNPILPPFVSGAQFSDRWKALVHPGYGFSEEDEALLPVVKSARLRPEPRTHRNRPKLGLALRSGPERRIINEEAFIYYAKAIGFDVVLIPEYASIEELFQWMQGLDVFAGVHNSMLANFLFMRAGSVLLQIVPFSIDWHADHHYGQGAVAKGLKYIEYEGSWWESSLSKAYRFDDDVRRDPDAVYQKQGYLAWRDIYMGQSLWLENSKAILALRCAKRYLLQKANGTAEDPPVPEYVRGNFYFEWGEMDPNLN
ncbi:Glycosyltransferase family 61 protein [Klebsormidium nitens]|uniref:Glycosyltransferase family 61 protein n=1 Tax=Klebsormidium nitens TaxID=105231 RepID=A0A1Y1HT63_KLENI|nr:Glycosyltransferase family 61 protein [Klebsormidium nitens]|eukprot:GAQ81815.1 Glycosyltransferase family 61 protein [Klebsormidium nitens]